MEYSLFRSVALAGFVAMAGWSLPSAAQPPMPQPTETQSDQPRALPAGPTTPGATVTFSRQLQLDPDAPAQPETPVASKSAVPNDLKDELKDGDPLKVTDAEREALPFTAYDLDVHLTPASAGISARAGLTVHNDSTAPLGRLVLQISSSLHWDAFSTTTATGSLRLDFKVRRIATDADHTGWAQEAVVTLPRPLAPGASITLTALYSGAIQQSAERLERIGAPAGQVAAVDWDAIAVSGTALRGFGDVLWYPLAAAPVFLGDGAKLFQAVGRAKLRQTTATIRLRLAVEYVGEPPDAAFFCGRREHLTALSDNANVPVAEAPGVATAVFDSHVLGFRSPNLFVTDHPASQTDAGLIAAVTDHYDALPSYSAASALVEPLMTEWLGERPMTTLNLIDHPGQPFEDGALLVRPMRVEDPKKLAPSLAHSLSHAWIRSSRPWIDEGLAQFLGLLWTERTLGRSAALDELQEAARSLALAEPDPSAATPVSAPSTNSSSSNPPEPSTLAGQSLIDATSDLYYRTKAAAVWWMLRDLTGDAPLKQALQAYRVDPKLDRDPAGFELTLEKFAHKDLRWFFNDWVYHDRGLPDLTIVNVTPSQIEAHNGVAAGWLVAVEVRNDGDAVADVPLTVRSNSGHALGHNVAPGSAGSAANETQRLRIPAHSSVSRRIVFAGTPDEVQVNDGGVPETRTSVHTRKLVLPAK
jgi:hypothetical protein